MINTFEIIKTNGHTENKSTEEMVKTDDEDPLVILKRRFARGEITQEEYEKMKLIIER